MSERLAPDTASPPVHELAFRIDARGVATAANAAARGLFGPDPVALAELFSADAWPVIEAHLADRARLTFDPAGLLAVSASGRPVWIETAPAPGGGCTFVAQLALPGVEDDIPPAAVPASLGDGDEPVIWVGADGVVRAVGRGIGPLLGLLPGALVGRLWADLPLEPPGSLPGAIRTTRHFTGGDGRQRRLDLVSRRLPDGGLLIRLAPAPPLPPPVPVADAVDALPCALLLVDRSERIRLVGGRLLPDIDFDPDTLAHAPLDAIVFPCARSQIRSALRGEHSTRRVALGALPLECVAAPVRDAGGQITAAAFLVWERSQVEDEHVRARRDAVARGLRQLAAVAAHDLSNALAVIRCHLDLARDDPDPTALRRYIDDIAGAAQAASDITRHLLAVGERRSLDRHPLELVRLLADATPELHAAAGPGARCEIVVTATACRADADAAALRDAFCAVTGSVAAQQPDPGRVAVQMRRRTFGEDHARWIGLDHPGDYAVITFGDRPPAAYLEPSPHADPTRPGPLAHDDTWPDLELLSAYATLRQHGGLLEQPAPGAWRAYVPLIPLDPEGS